MTGRNNTPATGRGAADPTRTPIVPLGGCPVNTIDDELVHLTVPGVGHTFIWLPVIPEDAPYRVREGIARQRIAATTGTCPCGAQVNYSAGAEHGMNVAEVLHDKRCPGHPNLLNKAARRWVR